MRILYMGSPDFAVAPLEALVQAGYEIAAVVTQPDRPAGRQRTLTPPPVKQAAVRLGLPVLQPARLRTEPVIAELAALDFTVGIVVAYGEILRREVLALPPRGYLNIHPSLLPLHRGPAPVVGAILAGDRETGVTIMQLDEGMDSGPILAQVVVPLPDDARAGQMTADLVQLGAQMLLRVLPLYAAGAAGLHPQDQSQATFTRLITKDQGHIDWSLPALVIERMTRAYDPWPGAFTTWQGQPLKVLAAQVDATWPVAEPPGTILAAGERLLIATGSGALELRNLQPAGKRPMPGRDWLLGRPGAVGQALGG